ncbi:MAG: hypothetical protein QOF04_2117 [Solirubrobacteraceae bacterium]|nr:hypothetical protein [Solirubrobacteraceae bacterium]
MTPRSARGGGRRRPARTRSHRRSRRAPARRPAPGGGRGRCAPGGCGRCGGHDARRRGERGPRPRAQHQRGGGRGRRAGPSMRRGDVPRGRPGGDRSRIRLGDRHPGLRDDGRVGHRRRGGVLAGGDAGERRADQARRDRGHGGVGPQTPGGGSAPRSRPMSEPPLRVLRPHAHPPRMTGRFDRTEPPRGEQTSRAASDIQMAGRPPAGAPAGRWDGMPAQGRCSAHRPRAPSPGRRAARSSWR